MLEKLAVKEMEMVEKAPCASIALFMSLEKVLKILGACERDGGVNLLENSRKNVLRSSFATGEKSPPVT
ncbi:hypothetical protein NL676_027487 [Syzygium grande]|nr:hypothetical protein NL676_027487 [Syzygium grande]